MTVAILSQTDRENLTEIVLATRESCDMRIVEPPKVSLGFQTATGNTHSRLKARFNGILDHQ